ncbi:MAG TPA: winged helix-turn-helix transcriptional regulator, partial [Casimicrobiaceae bacterium]|nr:winged helix-turn-helix transcriptional regulator [Casimicrobiaceae bacterium]
KEHRQTYYELLNRVRQTGDWETWLEFFADAVVAGATQAATSAMRLLELASADARRIENLGRAARSALAIHRALQRQPIATAASLASATRLTPATVNKSLAHLARLGVVNELTRKQRGRIFSYASYVGILSEGMARPDGAR